MKSGCWWALDTWEEKMGIVKQICSSVQSPVRFASSPSVSMWHFPNLSWWTYTCMYWNSSIVLFTCCGARGAAYVWWHHCFFFNLELLFKKMLHSWEILFVWIQVGILSILSLSSVNKYEVSWIAVPWNSKSGCGEFSEEENPLVQPNCVERGRRCFAICSDLWSSWVGALGIQDKKPSTFSVHKACLVRPC